MARGTGLPRCVSQTVEPAWRPRSLWCSAAASASRGAVLRLARLDALKPAQPPEGAGEHVVGDTPNAWASRMYFGRIRPTNARMNLAAASGCCGSCSSRNMPSSPTDAPSSSSAPSAARRSRSGASNVYHWTSPSPSWACGGDSAPGKKFNHMAASNEPPSLVAASWAWMCCAGSSAAHEDSPARVDRSLSIASRLRGGSESTLARAPAL